MLHRGTLLAGQSGSGSEDRTAPRESERAQGALQFKDGLRRVNTKKARCDLWDYLSHKPEYQHLYRGTYMANYSRGELTIDELEHCESESCPARQTTPGAAGKTGTALAQSRDTALAADVCGQWDGTRPLVEPVTAVGTALSESAHRKPGHSLCQSREEYGRKSCLPKGFFQPPSRKPRHSGLDHRRGYSHRLSGHAYR